MLHTKALYNLLRLNREEDPAMDAEAWACEDLRAIPTEILLSRLQEHRVWVDQKSFLHFAEQSDTPEELAELLFPDEAPEKERDRFYLIIFELWRRWLPERQSLSIFCDELDDRIRRYDQGTLGSDEQIQDALANLLEILDENADAGGNPREILGALSDFCAHDVESFIGDYIAELLDSGHVLYGRELTDGFYPYVSEQIRFDFLNVRLLATESIEDANLAMHRLLEREVELSLLFEILQFLSANGDPVLFKIAVAKALVLLKIEEEFIEIVESIADFYHRLDQDEKANAARNILRNRKLGPLCSSDFQNVQDLIGD